MEIISQGPPLWPTASPLLDRIFGWLRFIKKRVLFSQIIRRKAAFLV